MHLSVDSSRTLAEVRDALTPALAAEGFSVTSVREIPAGGFVAELDDPLPAIAAQDDGRDRTTYKVAGYLRTGGGSRLSTIRPTHLVELLDRSDQRDAAGLVERRLEIALFNAAGREPTA